MADADTAPHDGPEAASEGAPDEVEPFALSDVPGAADRPAEERGSLDLRTRALEHLAEYAAAEVSGTVHSGSAVRRSLGRAYPHASARIDAGRASLDVDVAVLWPAPVSELARSTRDHVLQRSRDLAGIDVRRVDVTVHVVSPTGDDTEVRRVQ